MPVVIPEKLPAYDILLNENVFVMKKLRALQQDIRPLKIAIVNLMPKKEITETQLIRLLANTPLQVELKLLRMESHESKNTKKEHLNNFYETFKKIRHKKFDGMIITGAPVETLHFTEVDYWKELSEIMEYSNRNVYSTLHLCWGAQAGLYHHYGIDKYKLPQKLFGVFSHKVNNKKSVLVRGFDEEFYVPHSRYTEIKKEDIEKKSDLEVLAESVQAGVYIASTKDKRQIFVLGHGEYDKNSLESEYKRDLAKGLKINIPVNYYKGDNPENEITVRWKGHANLFFSNWLNYCVYQETPYNIDEIRE